EATWDHGAKIRLGEESEAGAPYPNVVKLIFGAAWANPDFRLTFADRLYHHVNGDGALTDGASMARWQTLQSAIERAIVAESARWGDVRYAEPITWADWQAANQDALRQMEGNGAKLIELARAKGYYPPIDPPSVSPEGGEFSGEQVVTLAAPAGVIYYTLD